MRLFLLSWRRFTKKIHATSFQSLQLIRPCAGFNDDETPFTDSASSISAPSHATTAGSSPSRRLWHITPGGTAVSLAPSVSDIQPQRFNLLAQLIGPAYCGKLKRICCGFFCCLFTILLIYYMFPVVFGNALTSAFGF